MSAFSAASRGARTARPAAGGGSAARAQAEGDQLEQVADHRVGQLGVAGAGPAPKAVR